MRRSTQRWLGATILTMLTVMETSTAQVPEGGFRSSARELPEFARDGWNSTVFLDTEMRAAPAGRTESSTGSGTIVAHWEHERRVLIATSAHVVPCDVACVIRVEFRKAGAPGTVWTRVRRVWNDASSDLALLEARAPRGALIQVATIAPVPSAAAGVVAVGFPDLTLRSGEKDRPAQRLRRFSTGCLLATPESFHADYFAYGSKVAAGHLEPKRVLIHSADLLPGSSGGPLLDSRGRLIGINSGSLRRGAGAGCLVRETEEGARCVHLAIAADALVGEIARWTARWSASR